MPSPGGQVSEMADRVGHAGQVPHEPRRGWERDSLEPCTPVGLAAGE